MKQAIWVVLGLAMFCGAPLSAEGTVMPLVMDISGGRVQQAGANYDAGEKIRPVGWSKSGKFAWIVEHFVDGRGGTTFTYIILNTIDDKVAAQIDDDTENWETRQLEEDAAESWRRNQKTWNTLLKAHGIVAGSGLEFKSLPLIVGQEAYSAAITMIPTLTHSDNIEFFPNSGFTLSARSKAGSKQLASEEKLPCTTAWIAGYFRSPFENRMLVVVGREAFVFEGTEFFYHFYGCKLDSGFKK